jgi:rRNA maturation endonuclease Nob1
VRTFKRKKFFVIGGQIMGFFDELKKEAKKAVLEGMRGQPLGDDEDFDSISLGAEFVKEAVKQSKNETPTQATNNANPSKNGSRGIDIFRFTPKTNCKECNQLTCMAFAMKAATGEIDIDDCPYIDADEIKDKLGILADNDDEETDSIFCSKCGKELSSDTVFCPKCGTKVETEDDDGDDEEDDVDDDDIEEDDEEVQTEQEQVVSNIHFRNRIQPVKPELYNGPIFLSALSETKHLVGIFSDLVSFLDESFYSDDDGEKYDTYWEPFDTPKDIQVIIGPVSKVSRLMKYSIKKVVSEDLPSFAELKLMLGAFMKSEWAIKSSACQRDRYIMNQAKTSKYFNSHERYLPLLEQISNSVVNKIKASKSDYTVLQWKISSYYEYIGNYDDLKKLVDNEILAPLNKENLKNYNLLVEDTRNEYEQTEDDVISLAIAVNTEPCKKFYSSDDYSTQHQIFSLHLNKTDDGAARLNVNFDTYYVSLNESDEAINVLAPCKDISGFWEELFLKHVLEQG